MSGLVVSNNEECLAKPFITFAVMVTQIGFTAVRQAVDINVGRAATYHKTTEEIWQERERKAMRKGMGDRRLYIWSKRRGNKNRMRWTTEKQNMGRGIWVKGGKRELCLVERRGRQRVRRGQTWTATHLSKLICNITSPENLKTLSVIRLSFGEWHLAYMP